MMTREADIVIIGAGPVGLMCAYLANLCGLRAIVVDRSEGPLQVGRADALNARSLQLLEIVNLFNEILPLGKACKTSSIWKDGQFVSRQSSWWDSLEGCFHKHFLMLGQSYLEKLLDQKLFDVGNPVLRRSPVTEIELSENACLTTLASGEKLKSTYVIEADGSRSWVRESFQIDFAIERPQIIWAVIDAEIETDFKKVPEIIVFQNETSDVAWIPREGKIDRFYVRMDTKNFIFTDALAKINRAIAPYSVKIKTLEWFSQFSVKESVAEKFFIEDRVFLAGDACHIHSVNGGQGLNTGLADAFNLIWKLNMVIQHRAHASLLQSYESERKPVAMSVVESSGELVRATKYSATGAHAEDYVKIVEKRAGNFTGMGICYPGKGLEGHRLHDFEMVKDGEKTRIYSLLDYSRFTLIIFGDVECPASLPPFVQEIRLSLVPLEEEFFAESVPYHCEAVLVRPDGYLAGSGTLLEIVAQWQPPQKECYVS
jgi:2-polyprenyl-6-methoxyphenol hydroxylase-like FAD-dependent oxidoreductase